MEISAPLEILVDAMKRDGGEIKPSGEETPSKKLKVLSTHKKTFEKVKAFPSTSLLAIQPNPITPTLSALRSPLVPSRPREAFELLEGESPMKNLRPADDSSKKIKINIVKVGGGDLYHADEEISPAAEDVGEEEWDGEEHESDLEENNGPECLWHDGEHEPEEDPEEWIGSVADEVEEKRLQKMLALEKPERSTKGISYLTTRNEYDWGKKPYQPGDGVSVKTWERRSRLVAREFVFAVGERDDIFSPANSGCVLKLLPPIFLQRTNEEEEAREGEGAFS